MSVSSCSQYHLSVFSPKYDVYLSETWGGLWCSRKHGHMSPLLWKLNPKKRQHVCTESTFSTLISMSHLKQKVWASTYKMVSFVKRNLSYRNVLGSFHCHLIWVYPTAKTTGLVYMVGFGNRKGGLQVCRYLWTSGSLRTSSGQEEREQYMLKKQDKQIHLHSQCTVHHHSHTHA